MPVKQYTITILTGRLQGLQIIKYTEQETDRVVEYLQQLGHDVSVQEQPLKS